MVRKWVLQDLLGVAETGSAYFSVPDANWPHWVEYSSAWESKRTCCDLGELPQPIVAALAKLSSVSTVRKLRDLTGITDLVPAPFLHSGGLHLMQGGDHLGCHLDGALIPDAPWLERRVNLVLYLDGGEIAFHDAMGNVVETCDIPPGRAVAWEATDEAYHSVPRLPADAGRRATLAVFYVSPARPGVTRQRALWMPNRQ